MKIIGLIGSKGSGKTSLGLKLAQELANRGYRVAVVKHTRGRLDFREKDTTKYQKYCQEVVAISPTETVKFVRGRQTLAKTLLGLNSNIIIVEGFKKDKTFPKIICLKEQEKYQSEGLEIAVVRRRRVNEKKIEALCNSIEKRAFKLPGLNCGKCGFNSCTELAREIVKGKKSPEDCQSRPGTITVLMGGEQVSLNPFISKIFKATIKGFLANLKGAREGDIEIKIK